ncbi:methyltransferase domain-containing protein [Nocardia amamiensis]|uniref:Methyltransferase domain-containing protein n=1 Tax=Nocardia amamiensis TaxID=404578 RepID=A0ABS0CR36_9NOCA|nr:methyltransferase domain-containing protein [Nocardia amamiensis]MBF6299082.1 methyltransferase domain-containing protein [Nocardia amamiensis]
MESNFSEAQIAAMYDRDFEYLLELWDGQPVQHAGYFDENSYDYRQATNRTNDVLASKAGLCSGSRVLDIGCGTGDLALHIARSFSCVVEAIDLSKRHLDHASQRIPLNGSLRVGFRQASATNLPYADGSFSHVMSQDALYHVIDKPRSHNEISRVLAPGGVLAITDFLEPAKDISARLRPLIYEGMLRNTGYSFRGYVQALEAAGFEILLADDISKYFRRSYIHLAKTARDRAAGSTLRQERRAFLRYAQACLEIQAGIERQEFGWGMFVARKRALL